MGAREYVTEHLFAAAARELLYFFRVCFVDEANKFEVVLSKVRYFHIFALHGNGLDCLNYDCFIINYASANSRFKFTARKTFNI